MPRKRPKTGRPVGRPYAGRALWERLHWVSWVETYAEEHKQTGKPYVEILLDLLEMTGGYLTVEEMIAAEEAGSRDGGVTTAADLAARVAETKARVDEIIADDTRFKRISKRFKKKRLNARRELQMMKGAAARKAGVAVKRRPKPMESWASVGAQPHRRSRRTWSRCGVNTMPKKRVRVS